MTMNGSASRDETMCQDLRRWNETSESSRLSPASRPSAPHSNNSPVQMSLEGALRKLSLRPSSLCHQCRRAFASSAIQRQQHQSATASFADILQNSRTTQPPQQQSQTTPPPSQRPTSYELTTAAVREASASRRKQLQDQRLADMQRDYSAADLSKQITRRWKVGDVYAPHDLTGVEMAKWKKVRRGTGRRGRKGRDVIDQLGIQPVEHYKNFSIMSEYVSDMGRIKHSRETGLRPVNQRRMAKAVRRAIGIGLMPGVHRHPELLRMEFEARNPRY